MRWRLHWFSMELRKLVSYRIDFWVKFLGTVTVELLIAYYLWQSIYESRFTTEIGGYTFPQMMFYYLLVPLVGKVVRGAELFGFISDEIYEGGLTRYLVYPVSFFESKYIAHLAPGMIGLIQFTLVTLGFLVFSQLHHWGISIRWDHFLCFVAVAVISHFLFFCLEASLEFVAFWQDSVWSLLVMLRFMIHLGGGGLIPLKLFPVWAQELLHYLPFRYLVSFPIEIVQGQFTLRSLMLDTSVLLGWTVFAYLISQRVWRRGLRQYTGVGA